jgi:hypothetical protein
MKTFGIVFRGPPRERREGRRARTRWVPALTRTATAAAFALAATAFAAPVEIKLPPETARFAESPQPGYQLAVTHCSTCHSMDYVKMQPVSSRTYWKGSVTKMQKTFGAPIPDEVVEPIVDYLVKTYGNERAGAVSPAKSQAKPVPAKK